MGSGWTQELQVSSPMSAYSAYRQARSSWYGKVTGAVIEVVLADGIRGYGLCGSGHGDAQRAIVDSQVRDLVIGRSCLATDAVQDLLLAATQHYGRGGLLSGLISGIDIALWDAAGHLLQHPVSDLLGATIDGSRTLRPYLTSYAIEQATALKIPDLKLAMPCGPADGVIGMIRNENLIAEARSALGPDAELAIDCYMSWNIRYTLEMARRCRDYRLAWIEEPLHPDDIDGYRQLSDALGPTGLTVSAGEHSFTYDAFSRLVLNARLPIIQPDVHRAGGPTAIKRIAALADLTHAQVICHGIGLPTYHSMLALGPTRAPRCEYLTLLQSSHWPLRGEPAVVDGELTVPDGPGFGYTWRPNDLDADRSLVPTLL